MNDKATDREAQAFQKAWFTGVLYGEKYPEDGLARICQQVPEDCQDMEFAKGFYESRSRSRSRRPGAAVARLRCPDRGSRRRRGGRHPGAKDIAPEDVFPDDFCKEMVPSEDDVAAFAERTGATK